MIAYREISLVNRPDLYIINHLPVLMLGPFDILIDKMEYPLDSSIGSIIAQYNEKFEYYRKPCYDVRARVSYNSNGFPIFINRRIRYGSKGQPSENYELKYDLNNRLISVRGFSNHKFRYDRKGSLIEDYEYDSEGVLLNDHIHSFSTLDNKIIETIVDTNHTDKKHFWGGKLKYKSINEYDKRGLIIKSLSYSPYGNGLKNETYYEYDDKAKNRPQLIKVVTHLYAKHHQLSEDQKLIKMFEYDNLGNLTSEYCSLFGIFNHEYRFSYDGSKLINKSIMNADGSEGYRYCYSYGSFNRERIAGIDEQMPDQKGYPICSRTLSFLYKSR